MGNGKAQLGNIFQTKGNKMYYLLIIIVGMVIAWVGISMLKARLGILLVAFILFGIACQMIYARLLNYFLEGEDPVHKYGAVRSVNSGK
jgi:predicted metal-binding membrane protein